MCFRGLYLGSIWLGEWKSKRIENWKEMEKWGIEEILVYPHDIWLEEWKSGGKEDFFVWLRRK